MTLQVTKQVNWSSYNRLLYVHCVSNANIWNGEDLDDTFRNSTEKKIDKPCVKTFKVLEHMILSIEKYSEHIYYNMFYYAQDSLCNRCVINICTYISIAPGTA